jgi:ribosomal protein S18 acetylase RimI-like enzyme
MAIQTRIAELDDLEVVATLFNDYRRFYEQPADLALARAFVRERITRGESVILLAEDPQAAGAARHPGFCQLYPSFCSVAAAPIYVLYDLFVDPASRKAGVGRTLLLAAERLAAERGKARMDLSTAKSNRAAQSVYESLGWVRDEVFYTYSKSVTV